jgi:hypothetical protein
MRSLWNTLKRVLLGLILLAPHRALAQMFGSTASVTDPFSDMKHADALNDPSISFATSHTVLGWTLIALGLALVVVAVWSSLPSPSRRRWAYISESFTMRNLFFKVRFAPRSVSTTDLSNAVAQMTEARHETGYIRTLGMVDASIVTFKAMTPGERLVIFPDSLPEYPDHAQPICGRVIACRLLKGEPQSFQLRVAFDAMDGVQKETLRAYLSYLNRPKRPAASI